MIPFVEKTWFVWWIVAIVFTTRWFHVLARYSKVGDFDAFTSEEEAQIPGAHVRKMQAVSLTETKRTFGKLSPIYGIVYDLRSGKLIAAGRGKSRSGND
ncbi:MAG TPA: hypothetical protein VFF64_05470 [Candidatus Eremiobacteraceae bacterium]|nr:hypothetical protein [Candidatus Eremiobacteraceae bacterium]